MFVLLFYNSIFDTSFKKKDSKNFGTSFLQRNVVKKFQLRQLKKQFKNYCPSCVQALIRFLRSVFLDLFFKKESKRWTKYLKRIIFTAGQSMISFFDKIHGQLKVVTGVSVQLSAVNRSLGAICRSRYFFKRTFLQDEVVNFVYKNCLSYLQADMHLVAKPLCGGLMSKQGSKLVPRSLRIPRICVALQ